MSCREGILNSKEFSVLNKSYLLLRTTEPRPIVLVQDKEGTPAEGDSSLFKSFWACHLFD